MNIIWPVNVRRNSELKFKEISRNADNELTWTQINFNSICPQQTLWASDELSKEKVYLLVLAKVFD